MGSIQTDLCWTAMHATRNRNGRKPARNIDMLSLYAARDVPCAVAVTQTTDRRYAALGAALSMIARWPDASALCRPARAPCPHTWLGRRVELCELQGYACSRLLWLVPLTQRDCRWDLARE
jgi:hypothetical protein